MDQPKKNEERDFIQMGFFFLGLICIFFLYSFSSDGKIVSSTWRTSLHVNGSMQVKKGMHHAHRDELGKALHGASDKNNTVIIAMVNFAYVEGDKPMLDLFLDGFWVGEETRQLVDHLLIVAADNVSYERCKFLRLHCYNLQKVGVKNVGDEKLYMSNDFIQMMWRRTQFLGDVLKRGYSFVFTDTDVIWLRNPFQKFSFNKTTDLQISTDIFNGNELSQENSINTGFYMVRSNNKTIQLFDAWYAKKNESGGMKEQDVLQNLIHQGILRHLGMEVKFLDTLYFSGFCQDSRDIRVVKTVHANCCRSIKAKLADLSAVIHDWKRYKRDSWNQTKVSEFRWSPHVACQNSWRS